MRQRPSHAGSVSNWPVGRSWLCHAFYEPGNIEQRTSNERAPSPHPDPLPSHPMGAEREPAFARKLRPGRQQAGRIHIRKLVWHHQVQGFNARFYRGNLSLRTCSGHGARFGARFPCQGPWNVDLRTPPGPEGSNGSLLGICRGHPGILICDLRLGIYDGPGHCRARANRECVNRKLSCPIRS